MSVRVILIDDDDRFRVSMRRAISLHGYDVVECSSAEGALAVARDMSAAFDLALIDIEMPGMDGIELCRVLRARRDLLPIILLTGRDGVGDRILGLDAGADDYIVKSTPVEEVLARMRAAVRRSTWQPAGSERDPAPRILEHAGVVLAVEEHALRGANGIHAALSTTECQLLGMLFANPRIVLTRTTIYERIWGADIGGTSNTLDVFIASLRKKLLMVGAPDGLIRTVRGTGYQLDPPA